MRHGPSLARRIAWLVLLNFICVSLATHCFADLLGTTYFANGVLRFDDDGNPVAGGVAGGIPTGTAGLDQPAGIALGADGNFYVSSQGSGEILFYDGATGAPLPSPHPGGRAGLFATVPPNPMSPAAPARLRFGPDGKLYVADFNGPNVYAVDATSGEVSTTLAATVGVNVGGIAFGPDGALYVGDFSASNILRVHNGMQEEFVAPNSGGLENPGGLFFLPNGDLLVADLFNNQILRFDPNGQNPQVFAVIPPEIPDPLPPGAFFDSNFPSDFALDADGNLLVAVLGLTNPDFGGDNNRGAILRYDLEGNLLEMQTIDGLSPVSSVTWIASPTAVPGDYDGNDAVGQSDYGKWTTGFGKWVAPGGGADGSGNGIVDAADYVVWRKILENTLAGTGSSTATIPEPSTVALVVWIALMAGSTRRRPA